MKHARPCPVCCFAYDAARGALMCARCTRSFRRTAGDGTVGIIAWAAARARRFEKRRLLSVKR